MKINVGLVDSRPVVHAGVEAIVGREPGLRFIGARSSADQAWDFLASSKLDVLLAGNVNAGLVLKALQDKQAEISVLLYSDEPEGPFVLEAIRGGARGYVSTAAKPGDLIAAISLVASGRRCLTPKLEEMFIAGEAGNRPSHELLSEREFQVLVGIGSGKPIGDLAAELGLGVKTVTTYKNRVLEKLQMKSLNELIHYAISNGLVKPGMRKSRQQHRSLATL